MKRERNKGIVTWKHQNRYYNQTSEDARLENQIVRIPQHNHTIFQYEELSVSMVDEENYNSEIESEGDVKLMNMVLRKFLTRREEYVIRNFYGIGVVAPMGFPELADRMDVTPQRVRDIRNKGISKLRTRLSVDMFN